MGAKKLRRSVTASLFLRCINSGARPCFCSVVSGRSMRIFAFAAQFFSSINCERFLRVRERHVRM